VALVAYAAYNSMDMWTQTPDGYIQAASVGFLALIMGEIVAASRRYRATGVWPSGRQTPWSFFWVLPAAPARPSPASDVVPQSCIPPRDPWRTATVR